MRKKYFLLKNCFISNFAYRNILSEVLPSWDTNVFDDLFHFEEAKKVFQEFRKYHVRHSDETTVLTLIHFDAIITDAVDNLERSIDQAYR